MPSTRDIRRRIKSVTNTAKITKAVQMVAAAKMKRAQDRALAGRPYADLMNRVLAEVVTHAGDFDHPLMRQRGGEKRAALVVSTDKGLCGALNSNLMREVAKMDSANTTFVAAGRKGSQFMARTKRELVAEFSYQDTPGFAEARAMGKFVMDLFTEGKVDHVDVLYTEFINTLTQRPERHTLLPITEIQAVTVEVEGERGGVELPEGTAEFEFEPDPEHVLGALLPQYVNFQIYQMLLETKASEFSSKMVAMKNATDNANDLIQDLTLDYNKMRQASITSELLEIASAQMALE